MKKFHQYLFGRKFTIVTDHKPLMAILGPKKAIPPLAAARLQRWALILAAYDYQLEFKPTEQHRNADGLSHLPLQKQMSQEYSSAASLFNINQIKALPITATTVHQATWKDPFVSKVLYYVGQPKYQLHYNPTSQGSMNYQLKLTVCYREHGSSSLSCCRKTCSRNFTEITLVHLR